MAKKPFAVNPDVQGYRNALSPEEKKQFQKYLNQGAKPVVDENGQWGMSLKGKTIRIGDPEKIRQSISTFRKASAKESVARERDDAFSPIAQSVTDLPKIPLGVARSVTNAYERAEKATGMTDTVISTQPGAPPIPVRVKTPQEQAQRAGGYRGLSEAATKEIQKRGGETATSSLDKLLNVVAASTINLPAAAAYGVVYPEKGYGGSNVARSFLKAIGELPADAPPTSFSERIQREEEARRTSTFTPFPSGMFPEFEQARAAAPIKSDTGQKIKALAADILIDPTNLLGIGATIKTAGMGGTLGLMAVLGGIEKRAGTKFGKEMLEFATGAESAFARGAFKEADDMLERMSLRAAAEKQTDTFEEIESFRQNIFPKRVEEYQAAEEAAKIGKKYEETQKAKEVKEGIQAKADIRVGQAREAATQEVESRILQNEFGIATKQAKLETAAAERIDAIKKAATQKIESYKIGLQVDDGLQKLIAQEGTPVEIVSTTGLPEIIDTYKSSKMYESMKPIARAAEKSFNKGENIEPYISQLKNMAKKSGVAKLGDDIGSWDANIKPSLLSMQTELAADEPLKSLSQMIDRHKAVSTFNTAKYISRQAMLDFRRGKSIDKLIDQIAIQARKSKDDTFISELAQWRTNVLPELEIERDMALAMLKDQRAAKRLEGKFEAIGREPGRIVFADEILSTPKFKEKVTSIAEKAGYVYQHRPSVLNSILDLAEFNLASTTKFAAKYGNKDAEEALSLVANAPDGFETVVFHGRHKSQLNPTTGDVEELYMKDAAGNFILDKQGRMVPDIDDTVSVSYIAQPVAELKTPDGKPLINLASEYAYSKNARKMIERKLDPGYRPEELTAIETRVNNLPPEQRAAVEEYSRRLFRANDTALDWAVKMRFLGAKDAEEFRNANPEFVNMYRLFDSENEAGKGMAAFYQVREGGAGPVIDPLISYTQERVFGDSVIAKNAAKRKVINAIQEKTGDNIVYEIDRFKTYDPEMNKAVSIGKIKDDEIVIRDVIDGESYYIKYKSLNPIIARGLNPVSVQDEVIGNYLDAFLRGSKELLRKGVTVTPAFGGANFIRDSWVRAVLDPNASPSAIYNLAKGVANDWRAAKEVVEMTPFYVALQQAGAGGAGLIKSNMKKNTAAMLTKKAAAKSTKPDRIIISFANMVKHPFKTMENVNSIAEQLNRFQAAEAVFKKTGDIKKAAAVFNEVSTNFNEMGAAVRVINRYVPFFGASIGGYRTLGRRLIDDPATFLKAAEAVTPLTVALWAKNKDQAWWNELSPEEKNMYWFFSEHVAIPKPFEIGTIFGSSIERTLDYLHAANPETTDLVVRKLTGGKLPGYMPEEEHPFIPMRSAGELAGATARTMKLPTSFPIATAIIGGLSKTDPFTQAPIESIYARSLEPSERFFSSTSPTLRLAAKEAPALFDKTRTSPAMAQFYAKTFGGTAATELLKFPDLVARKVMGEENRFKDLPFVGGLFGRFSRPISGRAVTETTKQFYDSVDKGKTDLQQYNKAKKNNDIKKAKEEWADNGYSIAYQHYRGTAFDSAMRKINKQQNATVKTLPKEKKTKYVERMNELKRVVAYWYLKDKAISYEAMDKQVENKQYDIRLNKLSADEVMDAIIKYDKELQ